MASKRHDTKRSLSQKSASRNATTHEEKLRLISRFQAVNDPTSKRSVDRQYRALSKIRHLHRTATAQQRAALKARGHYVTDKGVVIDSPRDAHRERIPGAKMRIEKDGTVQWSVKKRRDLIIGLTKKEKREFATDPQPFIEKLLKRLRKSHPSLGKKKPQVRLQWGAYQATKDFSPQLFWLSSSPLGKRSRETKSYREKRETAQDRLTGLHFVYFVKGKKHARTSKK